MTKSIFVGWATAFTAIIGSVTIFASTAGAQVFDSASYQRAAQLEANLFGGLTWKVGDRATYSLSSSLGRGSAVQFVREETGTGFWMQNDVDMGILGRQKIEVLTNKASGRIEKLIVNGQEQTPPSPSDLQVIETRNDHIRVVAGEFDCVYKKIKNTKDNSIQEGWANDIAVPMGGMLKAMGNTQVGAITQELQTFSFAPRP